MASARTASISTGALALALALAPGEAAACAGDECLAFSWLTALLPLNNLALPTDGALVILTSGVNLTPADQIAGITINVTLDGQPVAGALTDSGFTNTLVWRPDQPLVPGGAYFAAGWFTNPAEAVDAGCVDPELSFAVDLSVVDGVADPLKTPEFTTEFTLSKNESLALADLACCDDAFPYDIDCSFGATAWDAGMCASLRGHGRLELSYQAADDYPDATRGLLATSISFNGEPYYAGSYISGALSFHEEPVCMVVALTNLASGETVTSDERCVGQDVADQLGPYDIDASFTLAGLCKGPLYTCELAGDDYPTAWDPARCTPLDPEAETGDTPTTTAGDSDTGDASGDSDTGDASGGSSGDDAGADDPAAKGCACAAGETDGVALLGLAALGLLARRRRSTRRRAR